MSNLNYKLQDGGIHTFNIQNVKIQLAEIDGSDIGSKGGLRFTMSLIEQINGKEILEKVDEFVIYPDAIDWKNGGKMLPEFEKRIKELKSHREESDDKTPISQTNPPQATEQKEEVAESTEE